MLTWLIFFFRKLGVGEPESPDPIEGITLRLRCTNSLTLNLHCDNDVTLRLPTTNSLTFQLRVT